MATATKTTKKAEKLLPLGDRVVVQRDKSEERTAGGILLPDSAKNKPARGVVVSVGDGKMLESGKRGALQVKAGDRVLFASYAGDEFKVAGEEYLLLREDEILATITD